VRASPLEEDLNHILRYTRDLWEELRGKRIFISGGTGFLGRWLLESLVWANERLGLGASAVVLTRDPVAFTSRAPHLVSNSSIRLHVGDIRSFDFPSGHFPFIIHAATDSKHQVAPEDSIDLLDTIVQGTRRILEFARYCGAARLLNISSGAIYGSQPADITHLPESYSGGPDPALPRSVYGESKRIAELLCSLYAARYGFECKIARCFAFVGPYLPLDAHFAIGNFIRDVITSGIVLVKGDGTPYRSYLYAADLAVWLWTILFRGISCRPYNVGSEHGATIAEIASEVGGCLDPAARVTIAGSPVPGQTASRYVPSTRRAQEELGLRECFTLNESIRRTAVWLGWPEAARKPALPGT
jgi:dTDP-glucose 4,6-dehydratase